MNNAGTERVIFNLYDNIDKTKIQFDFLVETTGELDCKIRDAGGRIYYINEKNNRVYYKKLCVFFDEHKEYSVVHTHTHSRMNLVLKAAKKCGLPCRIAHSHNARTDLPQIVKLLKGMMSYSIERYANYFFACSENAAKWLFPHKEKQCRILYNGIRIEDYLYNRETRTKVRRELGIQDNEYVMIHVGRLARQKNHRFLMEIIKKYNDNYQANWKALFVGDGPLRNEIQQQVEVEGLTECISFLGNRTDVSELLCAADVFVFPSLHEGLGIVVIEAQSCGLPCIVSEAIPSEADMQLGLFHWTSLDCKPDLWAEKIEKIRLCKSNRENCVDEILSSDYNIKTISRSMQDFYLTFER